MKKDGNTVLNMNGKTKGINNMNFHELIYAEESLSKIIKKEFPETVFTDASDMIHNERFEIDIETEDVDIEKNFYIYAIKNGFAFNCFTFTLMTYDKKEVEKIREWVKEINAELKLNGGVASGSKLS